MNKLWNSCASIYWSTGNDPTSKNSDQLECWNIGKTLYLIFRVTRASDAIGMKSKGLHYRRKIDVVFDNSVTCKTDKLSKKGVQEQSRLGKNGEPLEIAQTNGIMS